MSVAIEGLLFGWQKNTDYGPRLVGDLTEPQMVAQPAPDGAAPSNHPAWVFGHLNAYLPVIAAIIEGNEFADPKDHPFGMQSQPVADRSAYPSKQALLDEFVAGHQRVTGLLESASGEMLQNPIRLPRWENVMPLAGLALPYLMLNHENAHLGQLSAWRRVQGLPSV